MSKQKQDQEMQARKLRRNRLGPEPVRQAPVLTSDKAPAQLPAEEAAQLPAEGADDA